MNLSKCFLANRENFGPYEQALILQLTPMDDLQNRQARTKSFTTSRESFLKLRPVYMGDFCCDIRCDFLLLEDVKEYTD